MITKERLFVFAMIIVVVALLAAVVVALSTTRIVKRRERNAVIWLNRFNRLKTAGICTFFAGLAGICTVPTVIEFVASFVDQQSKAFLAVYTGIIVFSVIIYGFMVYGIIETTVRLKRKKLMKKIKAH